MNYNIPYFLILNMHVIIHMRRCQNITWNCYFIIFTYWNLVSFKVVFTWLKVQDLEQFFFRLPLHKGKFKNTFLCVLICKYKKKSHRTRLNKYRGWESILTKTVGCRWQSHYCGAETSYHSPTWSEFFHTL